MHTIIYFNVRSAINRQNDEEPHFLANKLVSLQTFLLVRSNVCEITVYISWKMRLARCNKVFNLKISDDSLETNLYILHKDCVAGEKLNFY